MFKHLDLALDRGQLLVIEGPNGSGKTSLLRGIAGLLDFETGQVRWRGTPIRDDYQGFRAELVWFSHRVGFKGDLNLVENLNFEAGLRPTDPTRFDTVLDELKLATLKDLPFRALSAGQQRRVALARMLLSRATLWALDEPFTNLDRDGQGLVVDLLTAHLDAGGMCIVATHQPLEIDGRTRWVTLQ